MGLEWVLLVLPVVFCVWLGAWIWARRLERAEVQSTADEVCDARVVTRPTGIHWSGPGVCYSLASVLTGVLALGALGGVIWGFVLNPSKHETLIAILFAVFALAGTGAALLIWQFRAAVIVPTRVRIVTDEISGIVFASVITPSLRKFFGSAVLKRRREIYIGIEDGISFWIDRGSTMVEVGRLPKNQIIAARRFRLPRSSGVDEAVVQARRTDGRVANLNIKPFTQAFDQSRALNRFLSSIESARSGSNPT